MITLSISFKSNLSVLSVRVKVVVVVSFFFFLGGGGNVGGGCG